jgi:hypothetical protein
MERTRWNRRVVRWTVGLIAVAAGGLSLAGCHRLTLVEGVAWFDADFDGVRDAGEDPAAGVTARVDCRYTDPQVFSDGVCDTDTTDVNGRYRLFVRVDPRGESQGLVSFVAPDGFRAEVPPGVEWFFSMTHRDQRDLSGVDAAIVTDETGALGDLVWQDDGDGVQEAGEPGVAGVPVELQVGLGEVVASTVTDADGRYRFEAVASGRYTVRFGPLPAGLRFTADRRGLDDTDSNPNPYSGRAQVTVEGGEADLSVDAGVVTAVPGELGQVGDLVWRDLDADGTQDPGEPGEPGVEVLLVGADTGQLSFTITDAAGRYSFLVSRAIAPDQPYRLVFAPPAGRGLSPADAGGDDSVDSDPDPESATTVDFTLDPDEIDNTWDAGIRSFGPPRATLGDFVWEDLDGDGTQDPGEPGVPDVTVALIDSSDTVASTTETDADGRYRFSDLPAASFRVRFEVPGGFALTAADHGTDDAVDSDPDPATGQTAPVTLAAGAEDLSIDAGLVALPTGGATIGDFAWRDLDRDGLQEAGEPGLPNLTVRLLDPQGNVVATTTTEDGGLYGFANVAPGTYRLRFISPPGLGPTTANAGSDDAVDSDINGGGETPLLALTDGLTDLTLDGGFAPLA